jgi:hypothetical protein
MQKLKSSRPRAALCASTRQFLPRRNPQRRHARDRTATVDQIDQSQRTVTLRTKDNDAEPGGDPGVSKSSID